MNGEEAFQVWYDSSSYYNYNYTTINMRNAKTVAQSYCLLRSTKVSVWTVRKPDRR